ncbi:hypothetical protein [Candidatus Nitrospira bockiana]
MAILTLIAGCAMKPEARLDAYLGAAKPTARPTAAMSSATFESPLPVGLVLVNDTTGSDSAPPLPEAAVSAVAEEMVAELRDRVPLKAVTVIPPQNMARTHGAGPFTELAKAHGVDHLLVVLISSAEGEAPVTMAPLGASLRIAATRVDNFTLVELALLEAQTGAVLIRGSGRDRSMLTTPQGPSPFTSESTIGRRGGRPFFATGPDPYTELRTFVTVGALQNAVEAFQKAWYEAFA